MTSIFDVSEDARVIHGGNRGKLGVGVTVSKVLPKKLMEQRTDPRCVKCGYSLKGLSDSSLNCPECGNPFDLAESNAFALESCRLRRTLYILLSCYCVLGAWVLLAVLPYHINGRAWYDYGIQPWSPPQYKTESSIGRADYDPKITRPFNWPWIGRIWYSLSCTAFILVLGAPIVLVLAIWTRILIEKCRTQIDDSATRFVLCVWWMTSFSFLYLYTLGWGCFKWLAD